MEDGEGGQRQEAGRCLSDLLGKVMDAGGDEGGWAGAASHFDDGAGQRRRGMDAQSDGTVRRVGSGRRAGHVARDGTVLAMPAMLASSHGRGPVSVCPVEGSEWQRQAGLGGQLSRAQWCAASRCPAGVDDGPAGRLSTAPTWQPLASPAQIPNPSLALLPLPLPRPIHHHHPAALADAVRKQHASRGGTVIRPGRSIHDTSGRGGDRGKRGRWRQCSVQRCCLSIPIVYGDGDRPKKKPAGLGSGARS